MQFPGEAHDTESNHAHVNSFCMSSSNTAGCAVSHSPSVMVMMNAMVSSPSALNSPTVVQFPGDAHDTDFKLVSGVSSCMSSSNTAGCGVSHSPSVMVMVNASLSPELFLKYPTAVQFPGVAHDTDSKPALGVSSCMSSSNTTGCAVSHSPSVDVMVNASWSPELFLKYPTAVQFPGDAHDTDSKPALGVSSCMSASNTAGRASSHSPSVMVMVNTSSSFELLRSNDPTAVQFPDVAHDTELKPAYVSSFCRPSSNTAGCASSHTPSVNVMVNAMVSSPSA